MNWIIHYKCLLKISNANYCLYLQRKVIFERRRGETERVVAVSLISVKANVAVGEEVRDEKLFHSVRIPFG